jgi:hypothetical protein
MMAIQPLKETSNDPGAGKILETIEVSAKRGADIVRQVLSFARGLEGQRIEIQPLNLLKDLGAIIKDTFPKNIRFHFSMADEVCHRGRSHANSPGSAKSLRERAGRDAERRRLDYSSGKSRARRAGRREEYAGQVGRLREYQRVRFGNGHERGLMLLRTDWDEIFDPVDESFFESVLRWSWANQQLRTSVAQAFRREEDDDIEEYRGSFFAIVKARLAGSSYQAMALAEELSVDDILGIYSKPIAFELQTLVEQAIALLGKLLESDGVEMAPAAQAFPEHLRFGVPTAAARVLLGAGLRHRGAAVYIGRF